MSNKIKGIDHSLVQPDDKYSSTYSFYYLWNVLWKYSKDLSILCLYADRIESFGKHFEDMKTKKVVYLNFIIRNPKKIEIDIQFDDMIIDILAQNSARCFFFEKHYICTFSKYYTHINDVVTIIDDKIFEIGYKTEVYGGDPYCVLFIKDEIKTKREDFYKQFLI
uniref:Uncharacterized protein n=1 Tax=viral metagenome TaxID=1070528 RepID=A0A6C0JPD0_9ZZZZ